MTDPGREALAERSDEVNMQYTPGPWRVAQCVRTAIGRAWEIRNERGLLVALVPGGTNPCADQATAHLIAAAPDLYEACEAALEHLLYLRRMVRGPRVSDKTIELLEAALSKARGEDA